MTRPLLFLFLSIAGISLSATAQLQFAQTELTFDTAYSGQVISRSVPVLNTGKRPAEIKSINTSCGCFVATWSQQPIPPGGRDTIDLLFNSFAKLGMQQKTATVVAGDGSKQVITLTGFVKKTLIDFEIEPKTYKMVPGKTSYTFDLLNISDHLLYIDGLDADSTTLRVAADKYELKPDEHATITATIISDRNALTGQPLDYFEIGCAVADFLHLTRSYITFSITNYQ